LVADASSGVLFTREKPDLVGASHREEAVFADAEPSIPELARPAVIATANHLEIVCVQDADGVIGANHQQMLFVIRPSHRDDTEIL
jgi:hypothetical protein